MIAGKRGAKRALPSEMARGFEKGPLVYVGSVGTGGKRGKGRLENAQKENSDLKKAHTTSKHSEGKGGH